MNTTECFNGLPGMRFQGLSDCPVGYYCPFVVPANQDAHPAICSPSMECGVQRLLGVTCWGKQKTARDYGAQGLYEPVVCPPGYYCPSGREILKCPERHYCPTGTFSPPLCDSISYCPEGSVSQVSYVGVVSFVIVDVFLVFIWLCLHNDLFRHLSTSRLTTYKIKDQSLLPKSVVQSPTTHNRIQFQHALARNFQKSMNGKNLKMFFEMVELGLTLPNGKQILKGVSGRINASRMTAIMGPSGAGKTTFMNVLCGKVTRSHGTLKISGRSAELQDYKKICGFVPQEDTMHRELSVKENILHSGRIRCPASWSDAEICAHVDSLIECLNLKHVEDSVIGDGIVRGVSGGQRKRVNIGIEVAATPLCLFLDEPTSGLDSTSSLEVMEMLDEIAKIGMTIVAVIHQPRIEIFEKFDDVLMIGPGGRTAYLGSTAACKPYFQSLGYSFPNGSNYADVLMDILSGHGINSVKEYTIEDLVENWKSHYEKISKNEAPVEDANFHREALQLSQLRGASLARQFFYNHNLSLIQQYRQVSDLVLEIGVSSFAGLIMGLSLSGLSETYVGLLFPPFTLLGIAPNLWLTVQLSLLVGLAVALAASPAGVKIFSEELPVYWRNVASGHSPSMYFLAKVVTSIYRMTLGALHFSGIIYVLANPIIPFKFYFLGIVLMFFGVYGLCNFVSMVVKRENATLLAVVIALFSAVFCGYGLTLKTAKGWGIYFIWAMQFNMYAAEANWSHTLKVYEHIFNSTFANQSYDYALNNEGGDYGAMVLIGIVWRICAFVAMLGLNREKQK